MPNQKSTSDVIENTKRTLHQVLGSNNLFEMMESQINSLVQSYLDSNYSNEHASSLLRSAISPIINCTKQMSSTEILSINNCTSTNQAYSIISAQLGSAWGQKINSKTRNQYNTKIKRLLPVDQNYIPSAGKPRNGFQRATNSNSPIKPKHHLANSKQAHEKMSQKNAKEVDGEIKQGIKPFLKEPTTNAQLELYPFSIWANPLPNTPGVLTPLEVGIMLNGTYDFPSPQGKRARLALIGGAFAGLTQQLRTMHTGSWQGYRAELILNHDCSIWLFSQLPAWKPDWINEDSEIAIAHRAAHRESLTQYALNLHPYIEHSIMEVANFAHDEKIFPGDTYQQAMRDLSSILISKIPHAGAITPGRLLFTFHGWANSLEYSWSLRYGINGRPTSVHAIPVSYTSTPLSSITKAHWNFTDAFLGQAISAVQSNASRLGKLNIPTNYANMEKHAPAQKGFTGSWSTPTDEYLYSLFDVLQSEINSTNMHKSHNAKTGLGMNAGAILMAMRPPDINNFHISPRQPLQGQNFAQKVKTRPTEKATWVERTIPTYLQPLWWNTLRAGQEMNDNHLAQPMVYSKNGNSVRFGLQSSINNALSTAGMQGRMRAYSLRHASRTKFTDIGLSDPDIAIITNHWARGFERNSFARIGANTLMTYDNRYQSAANKIANQLGWEVSKWQ